MTSLQVFAFGDRKVRTAGTHEAPLFCAADVCAVLGYEKPRAAYARLDQDECEVLKVPSDGASGVKTAVFVNESGLYTLILGSKKPEARAFKRWVTSEVLPAIRKHGFYDAVRAEQEKQTERLLAECFPKLPSKSAPMFRDLIAALVRLRREGESKNPPWARGLARMVYEWAIHIDGQQAERRKRNPTPNGSHVDHSMFSDVAAEAVKRVVQSGTDFARVSTSWDDWKVKMELAFGKKALQLPILVPLRLVVGGRT